MQMIEELNFLHERKLFLMSVFVGVVTYVAGSVLFLYMLFSDIKDLTASITLAISGLLLMEVGSRLCSYGNKIYDSLMDKWSENH